MESYEYEYEIDSIDLLKTIIKRWRLIALCAVLGIILVTGFGIYKNYSYNKGINANDVSSNEDTGEVKNINEYDTAELSELTGLNEREVLAVKSSVHSYNIISEGYKILEDEDELDSVYKEKIVLQYLVINKEHTDNSLTGLSYNIVEALSTYINTNGLSKRLEELSKGKVAYKDLKNGIRISYNNAASKGVASVNAPETAGFAIVCRAKTEDELKYITDLVKAEVNEYKKSFDKVGMCELILVDSYKGDTRDSIINDKVLAEINAINSSQNTFTNITKNFTDMQKALLNAMVGEQVLDTKATIVGYGTKTIKQPVAITSNLKKNLLIGFVLGIVLACVIVGCRYLLLGRVYTKDDMSNVYGLYCLGNIEEPDEFRGFGAGIDRLITKKDEKNLFNIEARRKLLIANIEAVCKKNSVNRVFMSSTSILSEAGKDSINGLIDILKEADIEIIYKEDVLGNYSSFNIMNESKNIILIEMLGKTKQKDLERLLKISKEYEINMLGFICI